MSGYDAWGGSWGRAWGGSWGLTYEASQDLFVQQKVEPPSVSGNDSSKVSPKKSGKPKTHLVELYKQLEDNKKLKLIQDDEDLLVIISIMITNQVLT